MLRPSLPSPLPRGPALCELAVTAPFALLAGGLGGWEVAPTLGVPAAAAAAGGSLALTAFVGVQLALEPAVVDRFGGRDGRWGAAAAYAWDVVTGTVVGWPLAWVLGAPALPGVGLALTAGAAYGFVMGYVLCGGAAETAVRGLLEGTGIRPRPDHSRAQALEARGEWEAAEAEYDRARAADPRDPLPYLGLARVLARRGDLARAAGTLREALAGAELSPEQRVLTLHRLVEIREAQGRRIGAAPDLARYLDAHPDGPGAGWARSELDAMKAELAHGGD